MRAFLVLVAVGAPNVFARDLSRYEAPFQAWCDQFHKGSSICQSEYRLGVFADNSDMIESHNSRNDVSYNVAHNPYSHLTWHEFREYMSIGRPLQSVPNHPITPEGLEGEPGVVMRRSLRSEEDSDAPIPSAVDWTLKGAVTPVKNQGQCGSCWSFSTTGALEGAYFLKKGELVSFSEQELVDCDTYDEGCNGGLMDFSFHWIQKNKGLCREEDYPYHAVRGPACQKSCQNVPGSEVKSWVDLQPSMRNLMAAVAERPVAVAIEADEMGFQFYSSGVLTASCGTNLDHGVLAVGYGATQDGTLFWKVKNSWGADWGMDGYILLERGVPQEGGECGILQQASYPILAD